MLLEIDQVPCRPPTGHRAALWIQLVPSCLCILPPSPASLTGSPRTGGIRTERDSGTPLSISITVHVSSFPSGQDPKPLVVDWITFVKPFYLIWQLVFLSSIVDWVKLSFTALYGPFFVRLFMAMNHCGERTHFLFLPQGSSNCLALGNTKCTIQRSTLVLLILNLLPF